MRRNLKTLIDDPESTFAANVRVAKRFFRAEDDGEIGEVQELLAPHVHYASFWGVVRGIPAAIGVLKEEQSVRFTWSGPFLPLTAHMVERTGWALFHDDGLLSRVPGVSAVLSKIRSKKVREVVIIRDGKVVFRELNVMWVRLFS
jgi:hypothetical protein